MFKTITAKHAGTCKRCRQGFEVGTRIRYGGPGRTYHLSAECPGTPDDARVFYRRQRDAALDYEDDIVARSYEDRHAPDIDLLMGY